MCLCGRNGLSGAIRISLTNIVCVWPRLTALSVHFSDDNRVRVPHRVLCSAFVNNCSNSKARCGLREDSGWLAPRVWSAPPGANTGSRAQWAGGGAQGSAPAAKHLRVTRMLPAHLESPTLDQDVVSGPPVRSPGLGVQWGRGSLLATPTPKFMTPAS